MFDLTLEQQFNLKAFEQQVGEMSREQAQSLLVELYRQSLLRENTYKLLLVQHWGIDGGTTEMDA